MVTCIIENMRAELQSLERCILTQLARVCDYSKGSNHSKA